MDYWDVTDTAVAQIVERFRIDPTFRGDITILLRAPTRQKELTPKFVSSTARAIVRHLHKYGCIHTSTDDAKLAIALEEAAQRIVDQFHVDRRSRG